MIKGFEYLSEKDIYLDSACQSLRPQPVIDELTNYYTKHNSCGERVKYKWGQKTDEKVEATRLKVLKYLKLSPRTYFVSFTLNTTYGLNLLLNQIHPRFIKKVITSDIEHNSTFLSTMAFGKLHKIKREVLPRRDDGSLPLDGDFTKALVVVNATSNFDGRTLKNIKALVRKVRKSGGITIIDAAQATAHHKEVLERTTADAICFAAHKMYAPSLGVMVVRRDLIPQLRTSFIGGGMVDDVFEKSYLLSSEKPEMAHTIFEPGLQAWGEICALGKAIDWLNKAPRSSKKLLWDNCQKLFDFLQSRAPKVHLINAKPSTNITFYVEGVDSHLIGEALGDKRIMVRTGYFCAHYYLDHVKHYPPLIRCSLGYNTRPSDIDALIAALDKVTR
jgi:cysteine desulfurase/selenocysteine lyase